VSDVTNDNAPTPATGLHRRRFLLGTGVVAGGALLAACGNDDDTGSTSATSAEENTTTTSGDDTSTTTGDASGDAAVAALAASLEVLAVNTYGAALEAANGGALGEVPPAVAEFVTVAQSQHQAHLDTWNGILEAAGQPAVTEPPADLEATVNEQFGQVTDVVGAARLALLLEDTAAATYLSAIPNLQSADAIQTAGSICCIDRQHAAVLRFVLGEYPVPEVFASTEMAYSG
jgi:hypothetical protein